MANLLQNYRLEKTPPEACATKAKTSSQAARPSFENENRTPSAKQHRPAFAPTAQAASPIREGEPCSFSFSLTPKPILKLAEHDPIDITIEIPAVTEQDAGQEIFYIASAHLTHSDDGERPTENALDDVGGKVASTRIRPWGASDVSNCTGFII